MFILLWNTCLSTAKTSVQTKQTQTVGSNGATVITTSYYTTTEEKVVSSGGKSVNGKFSTPTTSDGKVVASQPRTVANVPKQSAAATTAPAVPTTNLPNVSGRSGIQAPNAVPATSSAVRNTGSDSKQG
jgi:hypothetical protein